MANTRWVPDEAKIAEARRKGGVIGSTIPRSLMKEVPIEDYTAHGRIQTGTEVRDYLDAIYGAATPMEK